MKKMVVESIPVANIVADRNIRARLDEQTQAALADSIRQNGILVPLLGHKEGDRVIIDDGHGRFAAGIAAGRTDVPMIVSERAPTPAERLTLILVVNAHRTDLKVMERVRAIEQLMAETNWSAAEVSAKLGRPSASSISRLLSLLVLPRDVQDLIDAHKLPMSSAYFVATVEDAGERRRLIEEVVSGRLTRDKLAEFTRSQRAGRGNSAVRRPRPVRPRMSRIVFPIGSGRRIAVSATELTLDAVTVWIGELLTRLREAHAGGRALADVANALSGKGDGGSAS